MQNMNNCSICDVLISKWGLVQFRPTQWWVWCTPYFPSGPPQFWVLGSTKVYNFYWWRLYMPKYSYLLFFQFTFQISRQKMTYVYELMLHSVIAGYLRDPLNSTSILTDLGWPKNVSTLSLRLIISQINIASNATAHKHLKWVYTMYT